MPYYSELKRLAEEVQKKPVLSPEHSAAMGHFKREATSTMILALIADIERPGFSQREALERDHEAIGRAIEMGDEIPDFSPGSGNRARRRAEKLGLTLELPK